MIGMTCLPEAWLAREAEMCYALLALPTDYDCWRPHDPSIDKRTLMQEIVGNVEAATANCVALLEAALHSLGKTGPAECGCRDALESAVWTNRDDVSPETVQRYGVLLKRYFGNPGPGP